MCVHQTKIPWGLIYQLVTCKQTWYHDCIWATPNGETKTTWPLGIYGEIGDVMSVILFCAKVLSPELSDRVGGCLDKDGKRKNKGSRAELKREDQQRPVTIFQSSACKLTYQCNSSITLTLPIPSSSSSRGIDMPARAPNETYTTLRHNVIIVPTRNVIPPQ